MKRTLYLCEQDNLLDLAGCKGFNGYNRIICNELGIYSNSFIKIVDCISVLIFLSLIFFSFFFYTGCLFWELLRLLAKVKKGSGIEDFTGKVFLCYTPLLEQRLHSTDIKVNDATWVVGPGIMLKDAKDKKVICLDYLRFKQIFSVYTDCLSVLWDYLTTHKSLYPIHKAWSFYSQKVQLDIITKKADIYFSNQCDRWALLFDNLPSKSKTLVQHGITFSTPLPWRLKYVDMFYTFSERAANEACLSIIEGRPEVRIMVPTITLTDSPSSKLMVLIVSHINHFELEKRIIKSLSQIPDIQIIVKKHPTLANYGCYTSLQEEFGFRFIVDSEFPRADYVISYFSTLAYEYMAYKIPVSVYMKEEDCDFSQIERDIKQLQKRK